MSYQPTQQDYDKALRAHILNHHHSLTFNGKGFVLKLLCPSTGSVEAETELFVKHWIDQRTFEAYMARLLPVIDKAGLPRT
jgi:hypothetical protein